MADVEINKHKSVTLGGFKRGEQFSGVVPTGLAHLQYQLEGTRIIAMASILDATCLTQRLIDDSDEPTCLINKLNSSDGYDDDDAAVASCQL